MNTNLSTSPIRSIAAPLTCDFELSILFELRRTDEPLSASA
jgi:hypothetical protein